jgi:hypothetical protein
VIYTHVPYPGNSAFNYIPDAYTGPTLADQGNAESVAVVRSLSGAGYQRSR